MHTAWQTMISQLSIFEFNFSVHGDHFYWLVLLELIVMGFEIFRISRCLFYLSIVVAGDQKNILGEIPPVFERTNAWRYLGFQNFQGRLQFVPKPRNSIFRPSYTRFFIFSMVAFRLWYSLIHLLSLSELNTPSLHLCKIHMCALH